MPFLQRIRALARYKSITNLSHRKLAQLLDCSHPTVSRDSKLLIKLNLDYARISSLDDDELLLLAKPNYPLKHRKYREPDWKNIVSNMQTKHQTLYNQWDIYKAENLEDAYSYSSFCDKYNKHCKVHKLEARLDHPPGEEAQLDYCGQTVALWKNAHEFDRHVSVFVGAMCHSKYFFACATYGQTTSDWLEGQRQFFHFIDGIPKVIIPDNPKAVATKPRPNLVLNKMYEAFGEHFNVVIFPARPGMPQDKGIVEETVRFLTERVLINMENIKFTSLDEINAYLRKACIKLNALSFQKRKTSRLALFKQFDQPALSPLPDKGYVPLEQIFPQTVPSNYRIIVDEHYYSVPWTWGNKDCEVRVTKDEVTILHGHKKPVVHRRSAEKGSETVMSLHLHPRHKSLVLLCESDFIKWADDYGQYTQSFMSLQFDGETEKSVKANQRCRAIQSLARKYTSDEIDLACQYCNTYEHKTPTQLKQVLSSGVYLTSKEALPISLTQRDNLRGADYYAK